MPFNSGLTGEDLLQFELVRWARQQEATNPSFGLLYHCPNGGGRSMAQGMKLKGLGVRPGVPDLNLPVARGGYHGLWLELKDGDKGNLSKEQKLWIEALRKEGYRAEVVRNLDEGKQILTEYLK